MKCTLVVAAILLWSSTTWAQSVSFGPIVGFAKASNTDAKMLYGAALRVRLMPALAIEGSVSYRQDDIAGGAGTVRTWPLQVTGLLYPLPFAYAALGAGWYNTSFDFNNNVLFDDDTHQAFGWHFGGGVEIPLGGVVGLVADLRYVYLDYHFKSVPGVGAVRDDFYMATAGLLFHL